MHPLFISHPWGSPGYSIYPASVAYWVQNRFSVSETIFSSTLLSRCYHKELPLEEILSLFLEKTCNTLKDVVTVFRKILLEVRFRKGKCRSWSYCFRIVIVYRRRLEIRLYKSVSLVCSNWLLSIANLLVITNFNIRRENVFIHLLNVSIKKKLKNSIIYTHNCRFYKLVWFYLPLKEQSISKLLHKPKKMEL